MLTRESFLDGFADENAGIVAEKLLDAAEQSGGDIRYLGSSMASIRSICPASRRPIIVAWLYQPGKNGWPAWRIRDFSFGRMVNDDGLPEELREALEGWTRKFSEDDFTKDVSTKRIEAWAVGHDVAALHQDLLVERLRAVLSELAQIAIDLAEPA